MVTTRRHETDPPLGSVSDHRAGAGIDSPEALKAHDVSTMVDICWMWSRARRSHGGSGNSGVATRRRLPVSTSGCCALRAATGRRLPDRDGLSELRFSFGPGWRVYYLQDGDRLILLLAGGEKSTQSKDIGEAHRIAARWHAELRKERGDG